MVVQRRAEQGATILVQALTLDDDPGCRPLKRLEVRDRNAHVFEAQRLQRLEAENVTDQRGQYVDDRAFFEQIDWISDERIESLWIARHVYASIRSSTAPPNRWAIA